jgi:hypothetical protein
MVCPYYLPSGQQEAGYGNQNAADYPYREWRPDFLCSPSIDHTSVVDLNLSSSISRARMGDHLPEPVRSSDCELEMTIDLTLQPVTSA